MIFPYTICSSKTKYYWLNTGEENKDLKTEGHLDPGRDKLYFNKPLDKIVLVHITNDEGLYVGLPSNAGPGTKLIWTKTPFEWEIVKKAEGNYEIFVPGKDEYAFDNFQIPTVVEIQPGGTSVGGDLYWIIESI